MELTSLNGVGQKRADVISSLGINSVEELLHYYPYKINFYEYNNLESDTIVIKVKVLLKSRIAYTRNRLNYFSFKAQYENKILNFKVFNQSFLYTKINIDEDISVVCKSYKGEYTVQKILFDNNVPFVEVKYRSNNKISSKQISSLILKAMYDHHELLDNLLDKELIDKYKIFDIKQAVYLIHNPKNINDYKNALRTLKYYEAYKFMEYLKNNNVGKHDYNFDDIDFSNNIKFIKSIPFELTIGQQSVIKDIYTDISKSMRIRRIIHGDVGCGKTLVSIISAQLFTSNNYQVAVLCPTEVLARQMYDNYSTYIDGGVLLTSSTTKKDLNEIYEKLSTGEITYVVGTHSLLNDKVEFKKLGLVVIDEQHRFGVEQRDKLINKNDNVNVILMSATPIPRTMGLVLFDNLNITPIIDVPKNRHIVTTEFATDLNKELINDISQEITNGNLIYVVAPAINDNEVINDSVENVSKLYEKYFDNVGVIHGKLKSSEQMKIINDFKSGKIQVLVSTTVIEVGVDVANASRIIIHGASRFGLATLHQLRGRVGRSNIKSKCYIINDHITERLEIFLNCTNGFEISEADFKLRGPGNLMGNIQSGYDAFKLIDVFADFKILEAAKKDVN